MAFREEMIGTLTNLQFTYRESADDIDIYEDEHKLVVWVDESGEVSVQAGVLFSLLEDYITNHELAECECEHEHDGVVFLMVRNQFSLQQLVLKWRELAAFVDKWIVD